jgi:hypothetical protein
MALLGLDPATYNPNDVDKYFIKNKHMILQGASIFHKEYPVELQEIYRGILLEPHHASNLLLEPLGHITYLSFSEDENVARKFGDIKNEISSFVMFQRPTSKGYLIKHTPKKEDILFHHSWAERIDLGEILDIEVIRSQKEVMLRQTMKKFELTKL